MIGGNKNLTIQIRSDAAKNAIGEMQRTWTDVVTLKGWLDLMTGTSSTESYSKKTVNASHFFLCDYKPVTGNVEKMRAICDGRHYNVLYIDNPMDMNQHLEIFLEYVGDDA